MSEFINNAIFWVEVDKIQPNPFQPRREFDEAKLQDLARSIRQYGVIQPLTVTRKEFEKPDGGLGTVYELIAGERRLRASRLAGLAQVPVIIRPEFEDDKTKLEVAIIENLQREDLNPMDRAHAFERLVKEFGFKHTQVGEKVGKSREYVSNTIRLLMLPKDMQEALSEGKISEGHTRPLLMLIDRGDEQQTLFREIMLKKLTVRDTEAIARRIAFDKVRRREYLYAPEVMAMERELTEALGTRVAIEPKENGGKLTIDFMGEEDLRVIVANLAKRIEDSKNAAQEILPQRSLPVRQAGSDLHEAAEESGFVARPFASEFPAALDDRSKEEIVLSENTEDSFDPSSFSI
ncbi:MAG: ParB/RepB/Spo0J family partition protein [bacterium]